MGAQNWVETRHCCRCWRTHCPLGWEQQQQEEEGRLLTREMQQRNFPQAAAPIGWAFALLVASLQKDCED
jgi:hypothetical protein